ncbi:MAG: 3-hydroxyacyl-[acyl-carrier-protein] dehydratase FabZ [Rhodobacteraceae bacterium]|nr:MAG: 3-hydroxyacyl-[acyl-carrier-protein] dehydratase FabZ [Paracoccaceae bacterium]
MESSIVSTKKLMDMLPHRYPMLLIDFMEKVDVNKSAIGVKNVSIGEPFFEGHFPGNPIMPGVLIVEAMAQTAGALVVESLNLHGSGSLVYFMSIEKAKFRKLVLPGDILKLHVEVVKARTKVWKFEGQARVKDELVAESEFTAMMAKPDSN